MINNKIKSIVDRLNKISDEYKQPLPEKSINNIKKIVPTLSNDFIFLNKICRCDFFQFFDFYNFEREEGVIEETLGLRREYNLPNNYVVLFLDDVSFVLLKTISATNSQVIWCDSPDFFNLCDGLPMEYKPTIFPSFADFYEFLLNEEEKIRAEDKLTNVQR